jgi:hypothetical protein
LFLRWALRLTLLGWSQTLDPPVSVSLVAEIINMHDQVQHATSEFLSLILTCILRCRFVNSPFHYIAIPQCPRSHIKGIFSKANFITTIQ